MKKINVLVKDTRLGAKVPKGDVDGLVKGEEKNWRLPAQISCDGRRVVCMVLQWAEWAGRPVAHILYQLARASRWAGMGTRGGGRRLVRTFSFLEQTNDESFVQPRACIDVLRKAHDIS